MTLAKGDLLDGRYRIESACRERGAGIEFDAVERSSGAVVTIHLLARGERSGREQYERAALAFVAGARCAKVLSGPHVARVVDVGTTPSGEPWVAREFLRSETLAAQLKKKGALALHDAVDVALAVCDATAEAHSNGLLHGALGPHAIHVDWQTDGVDVKVTGAGTAGAENALSLVAARDGAAVLRAPEHLRHGVPIDFRADVWSIGVVLHTMLAGRPPFAPDTPSGASLSVVLDDPPRLGNVPDDLADAVLRALAKNPSRRTRNVLLLASAIAAYASDPASAQARIERRRAALDDALPREGDSVVFSDLSLDDERRPSDHLTAEERAAGGFCLTSDRLPASRTDTARDFPPAHSSGSIDVDITFDAPRAAPPPRPAPVVMSTPSRAAVTCLVPRVEAKRRGGAATFLALAAVAAALTVVGLFGVDRLRRAPIALRPPVRVEQVTAPSAPPPVARILDVASAPPAAPPSSSSPPQAPSRPHGKRASHVAR